MATLVWGMLPRLLLWILSWIGERKALAAMDFQGRAHRSIWRELTGTRRAESGEKPLDGVLVLDVGGSGMRQDKLRPFLLRNLRVNPTSWHSTAVWDETAEREADAAISNAPAGVVLICESWALSPARMNVVHADLRRRIGTDAPIKFLVANADASGNPVPVQPEEQLLWTSYVDSLRDPAAEIFPYRMDASVL